MRRTACFKIGKKKTILDERRYISLVFFMRKHGRILLVPLRISITTEYRESGIFGESGIFFGKFTQQEPAASLVIYPFFIDAGIAQAGQHCSCGATRWAALHR